MRGWECPGCGACYAPFVTECRCCGPETWFSSDCVTGDETFGAPSPSRICDLIGHDPDDSVPATSAGKPCRRCWSYVSVLSLPPIGSIGSASE